MVIDTYPPTPKLVWKNEPQLYGQLKKENGKLKEAEDGIFSFFGSAIACLYVYPPLNISITFYIKWGRSLDVRYM